MQIKQQIQEKIKTAAEIAYIFRFQICTTMAIFSGLYVLLSLFELRVLIGFGIFIMSVYGILYFRWKNIREKGIINLLSPKLRQILLRRSIFDIYRDQVYYPFITKIVGKFVKGAISKPHPQKLDQMFEDLPENVKNVIFTKGLLKLAPEKIQRLVIEKDLDVLTDIEASNHVKPEIHEVVPKTYGAIDPKWDKLTQYQAEQEKIHEHTYSRQVLATLNDKIHWKHIIPLAALVSAGIMKTKSRKLGRILVYNGSVMGIVILVALLIIKYKKPLKKQGERLLSIEKRIKYLLFYKVHSRKANIAKSLKASYLKQEDFISGWLKPGHISFRKQDIPQYKNKTKKQNLKQF